MLKIYSPNIQNLGDWFNSFPVISGLAKSLGDQVRLVVHDSFKQFKGFREFIEYQPCIHELVFRSEIINMEEHSYIIVTYSEEEFKHLTNRPNRPIETMRNEKFVRDNYPDFVWEVDDNFEFQLYYENYQKGYPKDHIWMVGDRWSKVSDTRRSWNILRDSGLFEDEKKFIFLDYENNTLMENAILIKKSFNPFIGTFTGSGMLADLLGKQTYCLWDDSMINWNNAPIEYSFWKHFYGDRQAKLFNLSDPFLRTL